MSLVGSVMIRPLLWGDSSFTLIPIQNVEVTKPQLLLYPNPVGSKVQFQLSHPDPLQSYHLRIVDAFGRLVYMDDYVQVLSTVNYPAGIYFVSLLDAKGQLMEQLKFIKQ